MYENGISLKAVIERMFHIMSKRNNFAKILALLTLGGLVGSIITLLLAPKSGRETRNQIKNSRATLTNKIKSARSQSNKKLGVKRISNWGNYPKVDVKFYEFEDLKTLRNILAQTNGTGTIPRGNGRCYGDSALSSQVISTLKYNKFLSFDETEGVIHCQSGVILADVFRGHGS